MQPYVWNHRAHEVWGGSRLCFWRFRFSPTYRQSEIRDALIKALNSANVTSYALYEIIGFWDVLARIWLPRSVTLADMEAIFFANLERLDYEDSEFAEVTEIIRHWVWRDNSGIPRRPEESLLEQRPEPGALEALNLAARGAEDATSPDTVQDFVRKGFLAPLEPSDGLKFFISIKSSHGVFPRHARETFIRLIATCCDRAIESGVNEVSLYSGVTENLILGRLSLDGSLPDTLQEFIQNLNQIGLDDLFRTRTTTTFSARRDFIAFQDALPVLSERPSEERLDVEQLLTDGETDAVEFKSTLFANLNQFLSDPKLSRPPKDNQVALHGATRAICAMLNSRIAGLVVLGVGERSKLLGKDSPRNRERVEGFLREYPVFGEFVIFGIDPDVFALGLSPSDAWDTYVRRLQEFLRNHIEKNPLALLRFSRLDYQGKQLAVIRVLPTGDDWFYVVDKNDYRFYVRRTAETEELKAVEQDLFKVQVSERGRFE